MGDLGDRPFGVISEGERQQVLLARALMSDPELLLLDEPFAGLDLGARERLLIRLTALAADRASPPIVLVTHHCEEIPPGFTHGGTGLERCAGRVGSAVRGRDLGSASRTASGWRSPSDVPTGDGGAAPCEERARTRRGVLKKALIQRVAEGTTEGTGEVPTRSALWHFPTIHHL